MIIQESGVSSNVANRNPFDPETSSPFHSETAINRSLDCSTTPGTRFINVLAAGVFGSPRPKNGTWFGVKKTTSCKCQEAFWDFTQISLSSNVVPGYLTTWLCTCILCGQIGVSVNGVSHDTRKQWKQHSPVQGQMWKSSAAQDSSDIINYIIVISYPQKSSAPCSPLFFPISSRLVTPIPCRKLPPCGSCRRPCVQGCRAAQRSSSAAMSMGVPLGEKKISISLYWLFSKEFCNDSL